MKRYNLIYVLYHIYYITYFYTVKEINYKIS